MFCVQGQMFNLQIILVIPKKLNNMSEAPSFKHFNMHKANIKLT